MRLTINLATRGRPEILSDTITKTLANIRSPDTRLLVSCDHDDPESIEVADKLTDERVIVSVKEREDSLGAKYNRALTFAPADVYLAMVDYAPHLTPGFDKRICDAAALFPDGIGVVYDHMANLSFPTINAVTHGLAERMGGMYPPWFPYWFIDHWLDDIAKMIGRIAAVDLKVDTSKRPGTMDRREPDFWCSLFDAGTLVRRKCATDIILSPDFQEPTWRKNMLLSALHLHEERSLILNQHVRQSNLGDGPPADERYNRIKARAVELMRSWCAGMETHLAEKKQDRPFAQHHPMEFMWLLSKVRGAGSILEVGSGYGQSLKMLGNVASPRAEIASIDRSHRPQLESVRKYLHDKGREVFLWPDSDCDELGGTYDVVFLNRDTARNDWDRYGALGKLVAIHNINRPGHEAQKLWAEIKSQGFRTEEKVESQQGIGLVFQDAA